MKDRLTKRKDLISCETCDDEFCQLTEFDEMGHCPTTLCNDPDAAARDWKVRICCAINQIERETRKETARR